jgi:hypothetical protein
MREHSAIAFCPAALHEAELDEEDGERLERFAIFGELVTRFSDRCWSGD